jgi:hypothetical protein
MGVFSTRKISKMTSTGQTTGEAKLVLSEIVSLTFTNYGTGCRPSVEAVPIVTIIQDRPTVSEILK